MLLYSSSQLNTVCSLTPGKKANITPLPKEGNLLDVNNYTPISLLPLPGKLHKQLTEHLYNMDNFDNKNQSGFRSNRSTISTIAKLTDDICINFNQDPNTIATFIDLKKAFDK